MTDLAFGTTKHLEMHNCFWSTKFEVTQLSNFFAVILSLFRIGWRWPGGMAGTSSSTILNMKIIDQKPVITPSPLAGIYHYTF